MDNLVKKDMIFVVDDNPENIKVIGKMLEGHMYEPMVFLSAKAALKSIGNEKPELILLDIMMPEMDGYEMCQNLKADDSTRDIPVIFLTGMTETEDLVKGFDAGAADYVTKPFESAELLSRIKTHIGFKKAKEEINTLRGLIPICAECKKIRDDSGFWNQIEAYIERHSQAQFSHGVCPECMHKLYEDQKWFKNRKSNFK